LLELIAGFDIGRSACIVRFGAGLRLKACPATLPYSGADLRWCLSAGACRRPLAPVAERGLLARSGLVRPNSDERQVDLGKRCPKPPIGSRTPRWRRACAGSLARSRTERGGRTTITIWNA